MGDILRALARREPVTILYRGEKRGVLLPAGPSPSPAGKVKDHPAFGMWKEREDLEDVEAAVRKIRESRARAV
jgi:PHD/YefM family antitoxin component YafN of YafNO toxin-antitoxin module